MNGYAYQLYSELRYWHPLIAATAQQDQDKQTIFDGHTFLEGDVPRAAIAFAVDGIIPAVSELSE
jgi:hypothetical protein